MDIMKFVKISEFEWKNQNS